MQDNQFFEIRLLFSVLKLPLSKYARIRRALTSQLGRGSFVLIAYKGVVARRTDKHFRLHAFFIWTKPIGHDRGLSRR